MTKIERKSKPPRKTRSLRAAIVGGAKGGKSIIEMVREDKLGRFQMDILGVADVNPNAVGMVDRRNSISSPLGVLLLIRPS